MDQRIRLEFVRKSFQTESQQLCVLFFAGTPDFAAIALKALLTAKYNVVGVYSKQTGSGPWPQNCYRGR